MLGASILAGMSSLLPKIIVMGLLAAVSPVSLMVLIAVMLKKHPLRNGIFFVIGFTIALVAIGVIFGFVLHASGSGGSSHVDEYIDIALGVVCLAFIPLAFRKRKDTSAEGPGELSPVRATITGAVVMAINVSTIMAYLAGVHAIAQAAVSGVDDVIAVAILTVVTLTTLLIPLLLYALFPAKAEKVLTAMREWLVRHGKWLSAGILLVFAVYLLVKGIKGLV